MRENGLTAEDIESVTLRAGRNVLGPIRFRIARTELEGKFSFAFLLSAIILRGRAGKAEFSEAFVSSAECQAMQARIHTAFDQTIEDMGWEQIRSRLEVRTKDGRLLTRAADEHYRGGPRNPLPDGEVEAKFRDCADGLLTTDRIRRIEAMVWSLERSPNVTELLPLLSWKGG